MQIRRLIEKDLEDWFKNPSRKPLLLRGARQVGKTSLIESFGKQHFDNTVTINFELEPTYTQCFNSLQPNKICEAIRVISQQAIIPGKTLLFLDEIQDCPKAIQALRYFKEKMPELHVIGAGSLLEFALNESDFRMPVGRVSFLYLYPLTFKEYLQLFNPETISHLEIATLKNPLPTAIHEHLLKQLRTYLLLGGMPEVNAHYHQYHDIHQAQKIQSEILQTYENDFGHYAPATELHYVKRCFSRIPMMVGQQIKYNKIDPDLRSRELKKALTTLESAAILNRINATSAQGLPLDATINEKKFKMNFIDVGLVKRVNQLDAQLLLNESIMLINQGGLIEQFVGQELAAYAPNYQKTKLYYWARDKSGNAEVDYVSVIGDQIYPVEVKSGKIGRLRSLQQYLKEHNCPFGIRISPNPLSINNAVLSIPLYMVSELPRLIEI